jgi:hypothetical protein
LSIFGDKAPYAVEDNKRRELKVDAILDLTHWLDIVDAMHQRWKSIRNVRQLPQVDIPPFHCSLGAPKCQGIGEI